MFKQIVGSDIRDLKLKRIKDGDDLNRGLCKLEKNKDVITAYTVVNV